MTPNRRLLGLMVIGLAACRGSAPLGQDTPVIELTSGGIRRGDILPAFTCDFADAAGMSPPRADAAEQAALGAPSPAVSWTAPPTATRSLALIAVDMDSPFHYAFVHWVLYDLPADKREVGAGLPKGKQLPDGSRQGRNDFDSIGYAGPCPPGNATHRYLFAVYALDTILNLPAGATRRQVESTLRGHILAHGELVGRYHR
jgi:Raf kinase inhibitor-like YbhB/YbcL family protein